MDRYAEENLSPSPSEKKKYRARGCRGGSKNKKRLDKTSHPNSELLKVQASLSSLDIILDEEDEMYDSRNRIQQQAIETTLSVAQSLKPPPGYAHNLDHGDPIAPISSSSATSSSLNISRSHKKNLYPIAENQMIMTESNIPQSSRSTSSNHSDTSESTNVSTNDYYTKLMNDPNINFHSINKLNQGYSSSSISSSLSVRDTRFAREGAPQTIHPRTSPYHTCSFPATQDGSTTITHIDASPIHIINDPSHHVLSAYTPPCPCTPNKCNLSSNLFSTDDWSDTKLAQRIDSSTHLTLSNKLLEPSRQHLFLPSVCDTSASSSSSLSSKFTPSIVGPTKLHNINTSVGSTLLSYPLMNTVEHRNIPDVISNVPSCLYPPSDSTPYSSSLYSSFDQDYAASFIPLSPHYMTSSHDDNIPRKIITTHASSTDSNTVNNIYTQCLDQTRANVIHSTTRRILPSWSIESDDRSHIKTIIGKKRNEKVEPTKVPIRLSSLPPIVSNSYSTLRDIQYGNQEPSLTTTHSSIASRSNQYTGALETFYRSFLPFNDQPDLFCNSNTSVWSKPKEEKDIEESFFNLSPHLFLHGLPMKENEKRR